VWLCSLGGIIGTTVRSGCNISFGKIGQSGPKNGNLGDPGKLRDTGLRRRAQLPLDRFEQRAGFGVVWMDAER